MQQAPPLRRRDVLVGRGRGEGGQVWSHAWRDVGSVVEYSIEYQFIIN